VIYAVSDSIGETAERLVKAAVSQFDASNFQIVRIAHLETEQQIDKLVADAAKCQSMICYTVVSEGLRRTLEEKINENNILAADILSPVINNMEKLSGLKSRNKPGLVHVLDSDYFKRVEAVEFAVKNDDGKNPWGLSKADIVLVGVSRTSKTPLSMYLAHKRIKVSNVPLVPELMPPEELFKVPPNKIIGLIINPGKLNEIRAERLKTMGLSNDASYANIERISEEIEYAKGIMRKLHCVIIDVSNKAIEETANTIIEYINKNNLRK
jgi:regulator of PEP synthase PpsR (kinase-PPPase family)